MPITDWPYKNAQCLNGSVPFSEAFTLTDNVDIHPLHTDVLVMETL